MDALLLVNESYAVRTLEERILYIVKVKNDIFIIFVLNNNNTSWLQELIPVLLKDDDMAVRLV